MEPEASLSWLALTMTPGIAARLSARLLNEFGSPEGVFRAESCNLPAPVAQSIFKKQTFWRAEKEVANIRRIGCRIVHWHEPECPQSLLQIYDPPVMLDVRGDVSVLNAPSLAVAGTHRPTVYGTQMAERMGRELAKRGLVIVSGLARGVHAIAHEGATAVGGCAIGVLGTGIDVVIRRRTRSCTKRYWSAERSSASCRPVPIRLPKISRCGIGLSPGCRWVCSSSKGRNTADH